MSTDTPVRIVIDPDVCMGIGACELLAPEAVTVGTDGVAVAADRPLSHAAAVALRDACPSGALRIAEG